MPQVRVAHSFHVLCESPVRSEYRLTGIIEIVQADDLTALLCQLDFLLLCSGKAVALEPIRFGAGEHVRLGWDWIGLLPKIPPDAAGVDFYSVLFVKRGKAGIVLEFGQRGAAHPEDSGQLRLIASFSVAHQW